MALARYNGVQYNQAQYDEFTPALLPAPPQIGGREAAERELAFDNLPDVRPARGARGAQGARGVVPPGGIR